MSVTLLKPIAAAYGTRTHLGDYARFDVFDYEPEGRGMLVQLAGLVGEAGEFEPLPVSVKRAPVWCKARPTSWQSFAWHRPAGSRLVSMRKGAPVSLRKSHITA